jgi:N-acetyl-beta-hexosaminidase
VMIITSISIEYANTAIKSDLFMESNRIYAEDHEAYQLVIHENGSVNIIANDYQGVKHALATLSQILYSMPTYHFPIEIVDWPDNHWRGKLFFNFSKTFPP